MAIALAGLVGITLWASRQVGISLGELFGNLDKLDRLVSDSFPPEWSFWPRLVAPLLETIQIAGLGTAAGCVIALPLALLAARTVSPNRWVLRLSRLGMNLLRTMPDLFWAMLFASAVRFGPFAGALALTAFTVAVISKLLSESAEAIDLSVLEAVRASGGDWAETVRFAVWPQIIPHFVSFTFYTLEINIRASTVLGLVGAGGIGMVLRTQLSLFEYDRVILIVLVSLAVVLVIERFSELARRRLV
jgi:phosphonate transport system permease protein